MQYRWFDLQYFRKENLKIMIKLLFKRLFQTKKKLFFADVQYFVMFNSFFFQVEFFEHVQVNQPNFYSSVISRTTNFLT